MPRRNSFIGGIASIVPDRQILIRLPEHDVIGLESVDLVRRLVNHRIGPRGQPKQRAIHGIAAEVLRPSPQVRRWIKRTPIDLAIADKFPQYAVLDVLLLALALDRPIEPAGRGP